jgi:PDZ domain-containing secreted protein
MKGMNPNSMNTIDQWWHQAGTFVKLVTASTNEMELLQCEDNIGLVEKQSISKATSHIAIKSGKKNFHEQTIDMFTIMVENNIIMVTQFQEN